MNLTPIQERRLKQTEERITFLEEQVATKDTWLGVKLSAITVALMCIFTAFFDMLIEKRSFSQFLTNYGWLRILVQWIFWFIIDYLFIVHSNKRELRSIRKELQELRIRYGLEKESSDRQTS